MNTCDWCGLRRDELCVLDNKVVNTTDLACNFYIDEEEFFEASYVDQCRIINTSKDALEVASNKINS